MSNTNSAKAVCFLGPVLGAYRSQFLLKYFKDNTGFALFYVDEDFFVKKSQSIFNRVIGKIITIVTQFAYLLFADIVVVPAMTHKGLGWYKLAVFFKKRIVVDFYISMYDSYVLDRKIVEPGSKEAVALMERDSFLMKAGNPTIFLNNTELDYYTSIVGSSQRQIKYKIIPLCIEPRSIAKLPYFNSLNAVPMICWWGSYIPLHGLEKVIEMAAILKNKGFAFKLMLFGNSDKLATPYNQLIEKNNLTDLLTIRNDFSFANGKLEEFLESECDLSLGNFGDSDKAKKVFINKIGDAFAMKIPVLTMETEALKELVNINEDVFISLNEPESMAEKILQIFQNKSQALKIAENGYSRYNSQFSVKQYFNNLNEVYLQ